MDLDINLSLQQVVQQLYPLQELLLLLVSEILDLDIVLEFKQLMLVFTLRQLAELELNLLELLQ